MARNPVVPLALLLISVVLPATALERSGSVERERALTQLISFAQPTVEIVQSVAGFYQIDRNNQNPQLVPSQADLGSLTLDSNFPQESYPTLLRLKGIGPFTYKPEIGQLNPDPVAYSYLPLLNLSYATYGFWLQGPTQAGVREPFVWGVFAAGSPRNFSFPDPAGEIAGQRVYCGTYTAFYNLGSSVYTLSNVITLQTEFFPSSSPQITSLKLTEVGVARPGGFAIDSKGASSITLRTRGVGGVLTGAGTALVEFFGPRAIEVVGTFSGDWRGGTVAGAFGAQKVPPGQPGC